MGHTPTPWYVTERGEECHISNSPTGDKDGDLPDSCYWIAMTMGSATDDGDDNANADFIVRAVNCHDELVDALETCVAVLTDPVVGTYNHDDPDWYISLDRAVEAARAALAKAKVQQ